MTHLGEGTLQELLDGELPPGPRAEAEAHLASCAACAGELAELRGLTERTSALLGLVEAAPPVLAAQARFARHRRSGGAMVQARRALPRAAALVLLLAGAAEKADFAAAGIGREEVEDLDAGHEDFGLGRLLDVGRCRLMDRTAILA
ncbi:MAG TPA: anti-sigma factor, partial [Longimicrobium sp.]|nr:anti-sigma factor [Longimicrobium sp.]